MDDINWDDDDEVEKYKRKLAQRNEAADKKKELKRNAHATDDSLLEEFIAKAEQVVSNVEQGYSFCELEALYIYFSKPFELAQKDAVIIIAMRKGFNEYPEVKLLSQLCQEDEDSCGSSEYFDQIMVSAKYKNLEMAVPALVDQGVREGIIRASDSGRLKELYSVWLKDVSWSDCELSVTNRPSLASWSGFPWDSEQIVRKHLNRGIVGTNLCILTLSVTGEADQSFSKLLWKKETGRSHNIAKLVRDAYSARKADVLAHPPKQKGASASGKKQKEPCSKDEPTTKKAKTGGK
jgi:hypothetical protein